MKFADLQVFVDIVEAGGMTQAAAMRGVSQPGLSRTVRDLERKMRATLLKRTGRGVEVTAEGAAFLAFARSSLAAFDTVRDTVQSLSGALPERLRLGVPPRLGALVFAELYQRFMRDLPDVTLTAVEVYSATLADGMDAGKFDLCVSYLPHVRGAEPSEPAFREAMYLVSRPGRPAPPSEARLADVAAMPLLLTDRASHFTKLVESAFTAEGLKLQIAREFDTAEGLLAFASEGEGPTILPYSNFYGEAARREVVGRLISEPQIERDIYIHAARHLDHRAAERARALVAAAFLEAADTLRWTPTAACPAASARSRTAGDGA